MKSASVTHIAPLAQRRRIFFIDIENYAGRAVLDERIVTSAKDAINRQFRLSDRDLVVIGASHTGNLLAAGLGWRGARLVFARGCDGADRALLRAMKQYRLDSFDEVFVVSGDGIFRDAVVGLLSSGIRARVVSHGESLSRSLIGSAPCMIAA